MEMFLGIMFFILGTCVGSFVNMLIYRTAVRYRITKNKFSTRGGLRYASKITNKNRSFCDYCGRQLRWYENIPVISWLIQNGKTRCCQKKLPISYPLLELGTGILLLIFNSKFQIFDQFLIFNFKNVIGWGAGMVIITMLVFAAVFDAKYMILPDFSTYILVFCALFVGQRILSVGQPQGLPLRVLSAAGGAAFLGILYLLTKGKGMGLGDVKLAIFMGLFLGWPKIVVAFYVAFIAGAVVGIILMAMGKIKKGKTMIPFGPFLILGVMVAWWWGEGIISNF